MMMRSLPFLLIACLALVMLAGEADAKAPEWSYETWDNEFGAQVRSVVISADGEYIVASSTAHDDDHSGYLQSKVYLFHKDNSTPLWNYTSEWELSSVAISADGEYIVISGGGDNKVYFFHKDNSTPLWNYTTWGSVTKVAISADGEYIAVGSHDYRVYLFHKDNSTPLWSYTTGERVSSVAISADGEYIAATGGWDQNVYLFHKDNSTPLWSYDIGDRVGRMAISADGEYILATSSHEVYLFDKDSGTPLWSYNVGSHIASTVTSVGISADGEYIAVGAGNRKFYLFGKDSSTPLWNYTSEIANVESISISADGEYIAVGCGLWYGSGAVYLFDKDSNTPLWSYGTGTPVWNSTSGDWDGPGSNVRSVAVSADGGYVVAGSYYKKVYLFKEDDNTPPKAAFNWSYTNDTGGIVTGAAMEGLPTHFDAGSSDDNSGDPLTYFWDFGNGSNGDGVTAQHIFNDIPENGFNVALTVTDSSGNQDQITYNIHPALMARPDLYLSTLTFSNETPKGGEEITINASIKLLGMDVTEDFEVGFFLGSEDGESIGSVTVNSADIRVGLENGYLASITWVAVSGTHTIYVVVDSTNVVDENEERNHISKVITVTEGKVDEEEKCVDGDTKIAEDGCNQCICRNEEWACTEVDCNPDDEDGFLPAPSVIASMAAIGIIALRRRY
jgi:outer membrane protein assembly factor BamB